MGYVLAVTHFLTQFTHVSRHPIVKNRSKQKKFFRENCFENVVSNVWGKKVDASTKVLLEKSKKNKNY